MSALPERYQRYAHTGQPVIRPAEVELYDDRDPIVYVPDAYGEMVPMRKSQAPAPMQPAQPRDLTPQPLFDPLAQRMLGGGIGAGAAGAGIGFGLNQVAAGIAVMGTSGVVILAALLLAATGLRGRSVVHVRNEQHTHVEQKWFGRTDLTNNQ